VPAVELADLMEAYRTSVLNKDLEGLMAIYGHEIQAFDTWERWAFVGLEQWREMNVNWFRSVGDDRDSVDFDDVTILPGEPVGAVIATVTYSAVSTAGEVLRSMKTRLTWIAKRDGGGWKILHQHASVPIDANLKAILQR
jgi:ketosteroid isomerase-like protein